LAVLTQAALESGFSTAATIGIHSTLVFSPFANGEHFLSSNWSGQAEAAAQLAALASLPYSSADIDEAELAEAVLSLVAGPSTTSAVRGAGLLGDALSVDAGLIQAGVQSFLNQLDQVGKVLQTSPAGIRLYYWLLAAAAATSACIIVRRHMKRQACGLAGAAALEIGDPLFPCTPEGQGGSAEGL
jgi:hypothetical protein